MAKKKKKGKQLPESQAEGAPLSFTHGEPKKKKKRVKAAPKGKGWEALGYSPTFVDWRVGAHRVRVQTEEGYNPSGARHWRHVSVI